MEFQIVVMMFKTAEARRPQFCYALRNLEWGYRGPHMASA